MKTQASLVSVMIALGLSAGAPSALAAMDDAAAMKFLKDKDCTKCHAIDKTKKGPSYKKIAAKYKEDKHKVGAEDKLMKHLTSSPKVKLEDGTEEEHKALDGVDKSVIKDLIQFILSR